MQNPSKSSKIPSAVSGLLEQSAFFQTGKNRQFTVTRRFFPPRLKPSSWKESKHSLKNTLGRVLPCFDRTGSLPLFASSVSQLQKPAAACSFRRTLKSHRTAKYFQCSNTSSYLEACSKNALKENRKLDRMKFSVS
ncbi:hypothetical protein AVEN_243911-1 [Araneus ventricosus]|uniref:Uncharacterized protein n=1 Tax=Araneus ventricosus TaxID=182803 RepID=A0A4Y2UXR4_ARAVE|nr:hypothetical protein AVEN_69270-1 [Araneus ventricosus]GBO16410.1 hypothetical protein AVEN_243911-1 [Araneus ventricosus]